jgi:glycosyltransferase involved in cell wall biosynthesis
MHSKPLISVIIPTYHRNDLLALCLEALSPTNQNLDIQLYEVIVSDDGKQGANARELVLDKFPWVKWLEGPHKGPASNRNNGAKSALGEWLVFIDDDCIPEKNIVGAYKFAFTNFPDIQVFEGKTICKIGVRNPMETSPINEKGGCLWSCNFAIQKNIFFEIGAFNINFPHPNMEDVEFRERLIHLKIAFKFIDNAIVDHPPRAIKFGKELAMMHESSYYYWKILKKKSNFEYSLLKEIFRTRIRVMINHPFSKFTFIALQSFIIELFYTIYFLPFWRKKYQI